MEDKWVVLNGTRINLRYVKYYKSSQYKDNTIIIRYTDGDSLDFNYKSIDEVNSILQYIDLALGVNLRKL